MVPGMGTTPAFLNVLSDNVQSYVRICNSINILKEKSKRKGYVLNIQTELHSQQIGLDNIMGNIVPK